MSVMHQMLSRQMTMSLEFRGDVQAGDMYLGGIGIGRGQHIKCVWNHETG